MPSSLKDIEKQALELSPAERELLASHLFQSVHHQSISDVDAQWLDLAEERYEALASGQDRGMSEQEFFQKLRNR